MKTSVILSTYNGEKYIITQMNSIKEQSLPVDEVIICDDCSSDKTCQIVQDYIQSNNLVNWYFFENEYNKGFVKNFLDAVETATGELLFYSDQDDIWDYTKVEKMAKVIEDQNALAVYCLSDTIDDMNRKRENKIDRLNRISANDKVQKISLCEKIKYARSPGLCLAFKKEIFEEIKRMSIEYDLPHDIPVGTVASIKGRYYVLNEVLVKHRVHCKNVSAPDLSIWRSFQNMEKQILSRTMKLRELYAIRDIYEDELSNREKEILYNAIINTDKIINCLKEKKLSICKLLFVSNDMMNKKLLIRNILSIFYYRFRS